MTYSLKPVVRTQSPELEAVIAVCIKESIDRFKQVTTQVNGHAASDFSFMAAAIRMMAQSLAVVDKQATGDLMRAIGDLVSSSEVYAIQRAEHDRRDAFDRIRKSIDLLQAPGGTA